MRHVGRLLFLSESIPPYLFATTMREAKSELKIKIKSTFNHNISIHILHTLLYIFPLVLTRRICLKSKLPRLVIISYVFICLIKDLQYYCKEILNPGHSYWF